MILKALVLKKLEFDKVVKSTRAYLFQIALEIMWLPIQND